MNQRCRCQRQTKNVMDYDDDLNENESGDENDDVGHHYHNDLKMKSVPFCCDSISISPVGIVDTL